MVRSPLAKAGDTREAHSIPGSGRFPGEENGNPLQYFLPEKFHGQRNLVGYSIWGHKEQDMYGHTHTNTHTHTHTHTTTTSNTARMSQLVVIMGG